MFINEIFESIQGEGKTIGKPAIFIRLMGCNLTCDWCDTKFTWHKDHKEKGKKYRIDELIEYIEHKYETKRIIFTGGEPLLQANEIQEFIYNAHNDMKFEIETNGTIAIPENYAMMFKVINLSPKLNNSGIIIYRKRYDRRILNKYSYFHNVIWKFVIKVESDIMEIQKYYEREFNLSPDKIYLMPEGAIDDEQKEKMQWVIKQCIKYGYNFSPRLQVLVYNDERKR